MPLLEHVETLLFVERVAVVRVPVGVVLIPIAQQRVRGLAVVYEEHAAVDEARKGRCRPLVAQPHGAVGGSPPRAAAAKDVALEATPDGAVAGGEHQRARGRRLGLHPKQQRRRRLVHVHHDRVGVDEHGPHALLALQHPPGGQHLVPVAPQARLRQLLAKQREAAAMRHSPVGVVLDPRQQAERVAERDGEDADRVVASRPPLGRVGLHHEQRSVQT
eukprot:1563140-Prymnesium_polylepis.1